MIEVKIMMFGAFRRYENGQAPMSLRFEAPVTVARVKAAFAQRLHELFPDFGPGGDQLIQDSAIANEHQVLSPDGVLTSSGTLSILPPVCGG